jgi:hypothetical protein
LAPFEIYQVDAYGKQIDLQTFNSQSNSHSKYLKGAQHKYITNKLQGGINGEDKYGGGIILHRGAKGVWSNSKPK